MLTILAALIACVGPYEEVDGTTPSADTDTDADTDSDTDADTDADTDTDTDTEPAFEPKVYFLYPGSDSDRGWTNSHEDARLELESALGVETSFATFTDPTNIEERLIDANAQGFNVFITASSDFIPSALVSASLNPNSFYLSCCGSQSIGNLTSYFGRMYQPLYVAGQVAAKTTCTKRFGVVAAKPNAQFIRHINAFLLGARSIDPDIVIEVQWLNSFFDPTREEELARLLVDHGADVLLVQTNSNLAVSVADESVATCEGTPSAVWSVGYHSAAMCDGFEDTCLTSAYWNWAPYYIDRVESMIDGTFDPADVAWQPWLDGADSVVKLLPWSPSVPTSAATQADADAALIRQSPAAPFEDRVVSAKGNIMIENGESYNDEQLDQMCWLAEGAVTWTTEGDEPAVAQGCIGIQDN
jgi:basic membrane protein A